MINFRPILKILGALAGLIGILMWSGLLMVFLDEVEDWKSLFYSGLICFFIGAILWRFKPEGSTNVGKREGYLIVALGWIMMTTLSTIPYFWSGAISSVPDAFFETVSGLTTTGATILEDIEAVSRDILYWRSLTQWLGGMGIIVLTVAVFPLLGIGGVELFVAEAPGPTSDKIHPKIQETAKRLWFIYLGLTGLLIGILYWEGLSLYDAINHAFTTMATGGYSTKNASIAAFDVPLIQYTFILFMFIGGTNYTLIYFMLKGKFRRVWESDEFRFYVRLVILLSIVVFIGIAVKSGWSEEHYRMSLFHVISIMTTTGYVTADYTSWSPGITFIFFLLIFSGACAGSTSGAIKLIRTLTFLKNSILEFKRLLHPRAIIRLRLNGNMVSGKVLTQITIFLLVYASLFLVGFLVLSFMGVDFETAAGASASALSNVGPAIGKVGPMDHFGWLPDAAKVFLSVLMIIGRLELFTILILFTPYFWRVN